MRLTPTPFAAILSLLLISPIGCRARDQTTDASLPHIKDATPAAPTVKPAPDSAVASPPGAVPPAVNWADIKNYTYDQRAQFFISLNQVEAGVDDQIKELKAKRAAMRYSTTDTQGWDSAMRDLLNARFELKGAHEDLGKVTYETWERLRDKVGMAWSKTQEAYDKVRSSTTAN